jgi:hypothetical protein
MEQVIELGASQSCLGHISPPDPAIYEHRVHVKFTKWEQAHGRQSRARPSRVLQQGAQNGPQHPLAVPSMMETNHCA